MKTTLTIILLLIVSGAMGQSKPKKLKELYFKRVDTLIIYDNGLRKIIIAKKVIFLKNHKTVLNIDTCDVLIVDKPIK